MNEDGYRMDDQSVDAVRELKKFKPENVGHIRQLLGLLSYHRRHAQDFAKIAKPLTNLLLQAENTKTESEAAKKGAVSSKK